jgi:hypothetical protein
MVTSTYDDEDLLTAICEGAEIFGFNHLCHSQSFKLDGLSALN